MRKLAFEFFVAALIGLCILFCFRSTAPVFADEWFDTYGKIDWVEEKLHLDNFAIFLENNPEMVGYIGFNWKKKAEMQEMEIRVKRARNYLIYKRKIDKARIVVIAGGQRDNPRTVLQPVSKKYPPPDFR